jgi:hypothetical protein
MSIGDKSGDRGGHTVGLPRTIHGPGNRQFRNSWTSAWQCAGVSSCYARLDLIPLFPRTQVVYRFSLQHTVPTKLLSLMCTKCSISMWDRLHSLKAKKQTPLLVPVKSPLCFFYWSDSGGGMWYYIWTRKLGHYIHLINTLLLQLQVS